MTIEPKIETGRDRRSAKLARMSDGFRVAAEMLEIVVAHGGDDALVDDVFRVCQREAQSVELMLSRKR